ncbi:MAG: TerC family protein [Fibrobacteraceae bacterium]|nr:TerC family protein [Fibrobacteraceae bacterium]
MIIFWIAFLILVAGMLALDLGVFNKKDHEIGVGEALRWTGVWIGVSLLFNLALYFLYGKGYIPNTELSGGEAALEFLTGYIIEKSLSMDNIFVMAAIFGYFKIPKIYQHRVLFWGILGAIIFRGVFVIGGAALLHHFEWIMYVFGALLIFSALKMLFSKEDEEQDLSQNTVVKLAKKFFPITTKIEGHAFFLKENGKRYITPLFLSLLVIETTDIFFAVDSIPAIFAVTRDPFIVFTSNIMAILGLRSLYFALAAMLGKFHLLKYALVFILGFVGVKMLIMEVYKIPTWISLSVIVFALGLGIAASFMFPAKEEK